MRRRIHLVSQSRLFGPIAQWLEYSHGLPGDLSSRPGLVMCSFPPLYNLVAQCGLVPTVRLINITLPQSELNQDEGNKWVVLNSYVVNTPEIEMFSSNSH